MRLIVVGQRARQAVAQGHVRFPAQLALDFAVVAVIVADIDALAIGGEGDDFVRATAVDVDQQLGQVDQA